MIGGPSVTLTVSPKPRSSTGINRDADVIVDTRNAIKGSHPNVFKLGAAQATTTPARAT